MQIQIRLLHILPLKGSLMWKGLKPRSGRPAAGLWWVASFHCNCKIIHHWIFTTEHLSHYVRVKSENVASDAGPVFFQPNVSKLNFRLGNTSPPKKCFLSGIARMRALPELKNTLYIFLYDGRKRCTSCPKEGEGGGGNLGNARKKTFFFTWGVP